MAYLTDIIRDLRGMKSFVIKRALVLGKIPSKNSISNNSNTTYIEIDTTENCAVLVHL